MFNILKTILNRSYDYKGHGTLDQALRSCKNSKDWFLYSMKLKNMLCYCISYDLVGLCLKQIMIQKKKKPEKKTAERDNRKARNLRADF